MNCNPCCGCLPPITTYEPSVANNFPTILQQVEYLKALLKKYPSQQWFITQEKVTEETKSLNKLSILSNGREPQGGDFILGNKENGTTLLFQYTGVITEYVNYNLIYVGVFTNQDVAEEALAKAQQALSLAQTNEQDITSAKARITSLEAEASIEVTITPASATSGTLTEEQYNTLITNDNCYIKLNEVVYTLSKNSATGVLIYSSKYLSDTKTVRTITVTKSSKAWVMTEVSVGGGGGLYYYNIWFTNNKDLATSGFTFSFISTSPKRKADITVEFIADKCNAFFNGRTGTIIYPEDPTEVKFCILSTHSYTTFIDVIISDGSIVRLIDYTQSDQEFADNYTVADLVEVRL